MDKWKVLGTRRFVYTSKKSGVKHNSITLYCATERDGVLGYYVKEFFIIEESALPIIALGDVVTVLYDQYGHVAQVIKNEK